MHTLSMLTLLAVIAVGLCALFATVATAVELAFRLPGWAARRLWRRFAR